MIELTWGEICLLYLSIMTLGWIGIWAYFHLKKKKKLKIAPKKLTICEYCQSPFLKDVTDPFSRCPLCQSWTD